LRNAISRAPRFASPLASAARTGVIDILIATMMRSRKARLR
jgi:hypothetical protein